jgi:hypothetical protein
VDRLAIAVDSCPPPRPPLEMNTPANLPYSLPCCQSWPDPSQNAYKDILSSGTTQKKREHHVLAYLPLSREVTVSGGNAAKEAIIVGQFCGGDDGIVGLGGGVHLGQNLLGESLGDPSGEMDQTMCSTIVIAIVRTGRW